MEGGAASATSSFAAEAPYALTPPATSAGVPLHSNLRRLSLSAMDDPHLPLHRSVTRKIVGRCRDRTTLFRTREVVAPRLLPLRHGSARGLCENATGPYP